jgi:hypothetical protein
VRPIPFSSFDLKTSYLCRHAVGDKNVFLVNTTGWVTFADVFPEYVACVVNYTNFRLTLSCRNQHPNIPGHQHIASKFQTWLENWGLKPENRWATPV